MAVVLAKQKEEPRNVGAHFGHQLVEGDVSRLAGGHLDLFAGARERHELVDDRVDRRGVVAERLDRRDHVLVLGDMVGAEHVDNQIEAAPELVDMVGDIGRAIDRLVRRARTDQHAILGQSERLALEPDRTVVFGDQAALAQSRDRGVDLAVADEVELVSEHVEPDLQVGAGLMDFREDRLLRGGAENLEVGCDP